MDIILIILCTLIIALVVGGVIWANIRERKDFNHGICLHCGQPLRCFDMDSQGGHLWTCDNCGYCTYTS